MPDFFSDFQPPNPVTGLIIEADVPASAVRLSWDPTSIPTVDFGGYRVYRSVAGGEWELLAHLTGTAQVNYDDYSAPLNTDLGYRVTQSNLDFESDPSEASTNLESLAWWIVMPHEPGLTFAVANVHGANLTRPKIQDEFSPVGRPGKLVVGDVVQAESGQLTFRILPNQPGQLALIHRVQEHMDGSIILKAPDGYVHEVQLSDITRSFTKVPGWQELSMPFVGVA